MHDESATTAGSLPESPVYLPSYSGCYVCGQDHPRGLRIRFFTGADGQVRAWFQPDALQTGYEDVVHGGVISALLDELIGWTVSLKNDLMAFTAELTVRFVAPVLVGRRYLASAAVGAGRGRCWEAEGALRDEEGRLYAKGRGRYFLLTAERTEAVAAKMTYMPGDMPAFRHGVRA
jgi:uncharacterized protein (TIGR00369 family)